MKKYWISILLLFVFRLALAQIDANSVKGIPVAIDDSEMNGVTGAAEGAMVYNMAQKNVYVFDGTTWIAVNRGEGTALGTIKYSVVTADHSGWYLLNGRATSSLSATAQLNATSLGFTTNLPDADDRVLKHPTTGQVVNDTGGASGSALTQAHLPNVTFTGTTSTSGNHSHTINRAIGSDQVANGSDANRTFFNQATASATSATGDHSHTFSVNTGGSSQTFERYQPYLVVNTFIYLGE